MKMTPPDTITYFQPAIHPRVLNPPSPSCTPYEAVTSPRLSLSPLESRLVACGLKDKSLSSGFLTRVGYEHRDFRGT